MQVELSIAVHRRARNAYAICAGQILVSPGCSHDVKVYMLVSMSAAGVTSQCAHQHRLCVVHSKRPTPAIQARDIAQCDSITCGQAVAGTDALSVDTSK